MTQPGNAGSERVSLFFYLERVSLQGSDGLQHVLQLATLVQVRHVAASSDALVTDEHPRHLRASLETEVGKGS